MPVGIYNGPNVASGNGVATAFTYSFKILDEDDLAVYIDGVEQTSGYTVSGVGDDGGGSVTFSSAPDNGAEVVIERAASISRETDYERSGSFDEETVDADFDRAVMLIQQVDAKVSRALKAPRSETRDMTFDDDDYADGEGKFIRRKAAGDGYEHVSIDDVGEGEFLQSGTGAESRSWTSKVGGRLSPKDFGAAGDGATDDRAAFQLAIDRADAINGGRSGGFVMIDLEGCQYGIGSPGISLDGVSNIVLFNGGLKAVGVWADDELPVVDFTHTGTYRYDGGHDNGLKFVTVDGNSKAGGVYFENTFRCFMADCFVHGFPTYGVKSSLNATAKNGALSFIRTRCQQWFSATGIDINPTTAEAGFYIQSADFTMSDCQAQKVQYGAYFHGLSNGQVSNCHFFGSLANGSIAAVLCDDEDDPANGILFSNCYFDTVPVILRGAMKQQFNNCLWSPSASDCHLILEATDPNERAEGLVIIGGQMQADGIEYTTSGDGSWASNLKHIIIGVYTNSTAPHNAPVAQWMDHGVVDANGILVMGHHTALPAGSSVTKNMQSHATGAAAGFTGMRWSNDATGAVVQVGKSKSATIGTFTAVETGWTLGSYRFFGDDGADINNTGAELRAVTTEAWTTGAQGTKLVTGTCSIGASALTDRHATDETGFWPTTNNASQLGKAGNRWSEVFAVNGTINTSDERLKMDFGPVPGLDFVRDLAGTAMSYRWKIGKVEVKHHIVEPAVEEFDPETGKYVEVKPAVVKEERIEHAGRRRHFSFSAQKVRDTLAKYGIDCGMWTLADQNDPDSEQGLRLEQAIPPVVVALSELAAMVESLKSRVAELEARR